MCIALSEAAGSYVCRSMVSAQARWATYLGRQLRLADLCRSSCRRRSLALIASSPIQKKVSMRHYIWIGALVVALVAGSRGLGGEPSWCAPRPCCFLERLAPVGGWHPDDCGLLDWWPGNCCFPRCGAPDDYCRKPLPNVCWPPCSSCGHWWAPEIGHPYGLYPGQLNKTH